MSDLRAEILRFADTLNRGTGSVAAVDVAWKLRQIAGATPTTGPAPAAADDDVQFEAEVFRLIDAHAPGLDDLDREDLAGDLMQLFRPDNPGCWAEDDDEDDDYGDDIRPPGPLAPIRHEEE